MTDDIMMKFIGKNVKIYISGGYKQGVLEYDKNLKLFYMNGCINCMVKGTKTSSYTSIVPNYFSSLVGIKKIEEVDDDE